ncbi:MAG TPA: ketopantoate reductase C-terminal domain-containing protein, partial [Longimicrobiaceae bacterium]|nr:ketopantoate reductase C-terminal domain-containing protein [Longimicrobiaceae bacterium]
LPGVARIFSRVGGPGLVVHAGGPASVTFGEWDGPPTARVLRLRDALVAAGVAAETPDDVQAELWAKFLFVVPMGGVGALARAPVGVLRAMPETRRLLEEAMGEILAVAQARGIRLPEDAVARTMGFVDAQPAEGTTSLQRDVAAGRPSELEAWCGAVVRLGAAGGVATPLHRVMYHALLPLERRARGEASFSD